MNFESEISPEDLFRMFFQGFGSAAGAGGHPFAGGARQFYSFNVGGGGHPFFSQPFAQQRRQQARRAPASDFDRIRSAVSQMFPVILFFIVSIFMSWIGSWSDSQSTPPTFDGIADLVSLTPGLGFPFPRQTVNLHIPYFASSHYQDYFKEYKSSRKSKANLRTYEDLIEKQYVKELQIKCRAETRELETKIKNTKDMAEKKRLKSQPKPSCVKLHSLGIK